MRVWRIPLLNLVLIGVYLVLLLKLSFRFRSWYKIFALGTTAITNVLLLGLSDMLAQALRSAANYTLEAEPEGRSEFVEYIISNGKQQAVFLDEQGDDLEALGFQPQPQSEQYISKNWWQEMDLLEFDLRRFAMFSLWGLLNSVFQTMWYAFLRQAYQKDAKLVIVVQRVLTDQLLYSPIMLCLFLYYLQLTVERNPPSVIQTQQFWENYIRKLSLNLCIWPLAQFINFLVIPSPAQIPFSSCISVMWNTYLSLNTS